MTRDQLHGQVQIGDAVFTLDDLVKAVRSAKHSVGRGGGT